MGINGFNTPLNLPPTAFYFSIKFDGIDQMESRFQEVLGLKTTVDTTENMESGDNNFIHHLPTTTPKNENLVLSRCIFFNSKLDRWCRDAIENFKFDPKDIKVALLGANGSILASWTIVQAFPISWELSTLNSTSNQLSIESLTLKYRLFRKD